MCGKSINDFNGTKAPLAMAGTTHPQEAR